MQFQGRGMLQICPLCSSGQKMKLLYKGECTKLYISLVMYKSASTLLASKERFRAVSNFQKITFDNYC